MTEERPMTKVSFNLPAEDLATLKAIAARRNITVTQALRQAIATEKFVEDTIQRGGKLLVQRDKTVTEVVFRP